MSAQVTPTKALSGFHVLVILLASFAAVFAVNGVMIYCAIATFRGEIETHPYLTGLGYNATLANVAAQHALNWSHDVTVTAGVGEVTVIAAYRDANGRPLEDLAVSAIVLRPADDAAGFTAPVGRSDDGGYRGTYSVSRPGRWAVRVTAARGGADLYRLDYEVIVK